MKILTLFMTHDGHRLLFGYARHTTSKAFGQDLEK